MVKRIRLDDGKKKPSKPRLVVDNADKPQKKSRPNDFKPGNKHQIIGNVRRPAIRAQERFITSAIMHELQRRCADKDGNASTFMERIAKKLVSTAVLGSDKDAVAAFREIADRIEGKPKQAVELTGNKDKPVQIALASMTATEAARVYKQFLRPDDDI